jgi:hypothetical protein
MEMISTRGLLFAVEELTEVLLQVLVQDATTREII